MAAFQQMFMESILVITCDLTYDLPLLLILRQILTLDDGYYKNVPTIDYL